MIYHIMSYQMDQIIIQQQKMNCKSSVQNIVNKKNLFSVLGKFVGIKLYYQIVWWKWCQMWNDDSFVKS